MVTVYVWNAHYAKGSAGHASLAVSGGQPSGNIYISWWPEGRNLKTITVGVRRGVHSQLSFDEVSTAEGRRPDYTVQLQGLDETAIKAFWNGQIRNPTYQGFSCNCATTVGQALEEGGGGHYAREWSSPAVWTPADVLRYAQAIQSGLAAGRSPSQLRVSAR